MSIVRSGVRVGAAAFALGLSLACPQSVGVAAADGTDSDSTSVSTGPASPSTGAGQATTATRSLASRSMRRAPSSRADAPQTQTPAPADPAAGPVARASDAAKVAADADSAVPRQLPRPASAVRAPRAANKATPTTTNTVETPPAGSSQPAARVAAVVALPAYTDAGAPIASAVAGASPSAAEIDWRTRGLAPVARPAWTLSPAAILDHILYTATNWLSSLPANPIADFLQGALLLVRRTLIPDFAPPTEAPPSTPTPGWNNGRGTDSFWYRTGIDLQGDTRTWPVLRGTPGAPLIGTHDWLSTTDFQDPHYPYDGVQGIIYNHSDQTIAVRTVAIFPNKVVVPGPEALVWQTAILEPGDAVSYQLFNSDPHSDDVNYLTFYQAAKDRQGNYYTFGDPIGLGLIDYDFAQPSTYFVPAGVSPPPSPREGWREGEEHHDIWGSVDIATKREGDGWQINPSRAYLDRYPDPSNEYTADWAIFTINVYSL